MAAGAKRINVAPGTEIASLLEEASDHPVVLEANGKLFRLHRIDRSEEIWADYDPAAALAGIEEGAGTWNDLDPEQVKALIYCAREEGTRPADRP